MFSNYWPALFIHEEMTDFQYIRDDGTNKTPCRGQTREVLYVVKREFHTVTVAAF